MPFLRDFQGAMNLPELDAVLAVQIIHIARATCPDRSVILEDRPSFERELRSIVLLAAVPAVILLKENGRSCAAAWTLDAIGPATGHKIFAAVIRIVEVEDRFL